jgi:antitoxin HicB
MSKKHLGSSIDDFLKEEGIFEEAQAQAVKEVVAWQLAEAMKERKISKNKMATLLKTRKTTSRCPVSSAPQQWLAVVFQSS